MPSNENANPTQGTGPSATSDKQTGKRARDHDAEEEVEALGPRKRGMKTDRLVHYGRHFGRTVRTFVNFHSLIREGVLREEQLAARGISIKALPDADRAEHALFHQLLKMCPFLSDQIFELNRTDNYIAYAADMLSKGANGARSDDVRSLKSAVIEWITPVGGVLTPHIPRHNRDARGFFHEVTGKYLCPTDYDWSYPNVKQQLRSGKVIVSGLQWPMLLYAGVKCDQNDLWNGLLRGRILVQAYKHIFTSPSSVEGESRATRAGNARLHGMKAVTIPSLAYVATLVRFSLGTQATFSRSDTVSDSQRFYNTLIDFLEMEDEREPVAELLDWWNKQIFPHESAVGYHSVPHTCALARLKEQTRARLAALTNNSADSTPTSSSPSSSDV